MIVTQTILHALQITCFVSLMMIAVEYLNVLTQGTWQRLLGKAGWQQYAMAVLLGATPGCLGAFTVVALYTHRTVSLGALVACMIATSGDEAFVMLSLFPGTALGLNVGLIVVGLAAGAVTDLVSGRQLAAADHGLDLHAEPECECFPSGRIVSQLRNLTPARGILAAAIGLFLLGLLLGEVGPESWNWVRYTLLLVGGFGLFVTLTVPDHFLEQHFWNHIALQHVPRIFAWTLGALTVIAVLRGLGSSATLLGQNRWQILGAASLLGLIPESGPHLLFVTLYDEQMIPLSTLVASSIVQDGHGMLPLLAASRLDFVKVKTINLVAGLVVGGLMMMLGW